MKRIDQHNCWSVWWCWWKMSFFNTLFQEVLEVHAPIKSVRVKKNPAPWISKLIRDEMDKWKRLLELHPKHTHPLFCGHSSKHRETMWSPYRSKPKRSTSFASFSQRPVPPPYMWKSLNQACRNDQMDCWTSLNPDHKSFTDAMCWIMTTLSWSVPRPRLQMSLWPLLLMLLEILS